MELLNDIRNYPLLQRNEKIQLMVFLVALSSVLSIIDSFLTRPFLVKLGIANIVMMVLINEKRFSLCFFVQLLRILFSSIMIGTLFSFSFVLSFSGGVLSFFVAMISKNFLRGLSLYGISLIASFFHILGQAMWVFLLFGLSKANVYMVCIFLIFGLITGGVIGYFSTLCYRNFGEMEEIVVNGGA